MASLLDITVKTLDSTNHKFNIAEDKTVKEFKVEIEKVINVPSTSQRLIYCGRVLQDEKQLKDYNLDKKVVHLVQRVPPSQRPPSSGTSTSSRSSAANSPRRINISTARGFDSNTLEMIHLAAHNRISLVNHMLSRAENCLARMEDPSIPAQGPADHINLTAMAADGDDAFVGPELAGTLTTSISVSDSPDGNNPTTLGGAVSAAVAGALSAIVSAVNTSMGGNTNITVGAPNITVTSMSSDVPMDSSPEPSVATNEEVPAEPAVASNSSASSASAGSASASASAEAAPSASSASPEQPASSSSTSTSTPGTPQRQRRGSPISAMADAIDQMNRIQDRLRPFSDELTQVMRADPNFQGENNGLEEVQRRFSLMSEAMHFISHAYHHLSDLSLGLTRPPPRTLGVRSLVLQPAFVQGVGIPVQAQINVVSGRISPPRSTPSQGAPQTPAGATQAAGTGPAPAETTQQQPPPAGAAAAGRQGQGGQFMPDIMMGPMFEARRSSFTLPSGGNVEVVMEMTPGSLTYVPGPAGGMGGHSHGHVHEASPDLMRAIIMHAMSHQMGAQGGAPQAAAPAAAQPSAGNAGTAPTTSAMPGAPQAGSPAQNSQARGSATTNPTTSTQTRSTPRPHVHLAPVNVPVSNMFDPYLMCSSHHIHSRRRQTESTQTTASSQTQPATPTRTQTTTTQAQPSPRAPAPAPPTNASPINAMNVDDILRRSLMDIIPHDHFANWRMPTINWPTSPGQGESIFSQIISTVTQNLTLEDILQIGLQQGTPLSGVRTPMREIVNTQLLRGEPATPENINQAVDRMMHEIPLTNMLQSWNQLRPGININETFRRYYRDQLNLFLDLVNNDSITPNQFGPRLLGFSGQFLRYLTSLTLLCCRDGRRGLEEFIHSTVNRLIPSPSSPTPMSVLHGRNSMSSYFLAMQIDTPAVERYIQRLPTVPDSTAPIPSERQTAAPRTAASEEAMECDEEFVLAAEELPTQQATPAPKEDEGSATVLPPLETDASGACDVVVGAEEWHSGLDPEWVPVISRDMQRQRRQPDQPPFSDSYLAGMSSKRRKLVNSNKPQGSVSQAIAKSVASAASTAGVSNADQLSKAAAADPAVQVAYKEEMKKAVQQQLSMNPDFAPDRHPNANKYFKPSKQ